MATTSLMNVENVYKRTLEYSSSDDENVVQAKRHAFPYFFRLATESPPHASEDTESVTSMQAVETDFARDTADTDTKSEDSDDSDSLSVEYDVASLSENDNPFFDPNSSSGTDDMLAAASVLAAVYACKSDVWTTDAEDSDSSVSSDHERQIKQPDYWHCVQCNGINQNRSYRYCEKCYKIRKNLFPPRPRGHRPRKQNVPTNTEKYISSSNKPVKSDNKFIKNSFGSQTQDSGLGSSQESFPSVGAKEEITINGGNNEDGNDNNDGNAIETKLKVTAANAAKDENKLIPKEKLIDTNEMCIICNVSPKNGIFVHGKIGHICCCYKCSVKAWTKNNKCPACNCKVMNVLKAFTL